MKGLTYSIGACALYALSAIGCVSDRYARQQEYIHQLERDYDELYTVSIKLLDELKSAVEKEKKETKLREQEITSLEQKLEKEVISEIIAGHERFKEIIKAMEETAKKFKKPK